MFEAMGLKIIASRSVPNFMKIYHAVSGGYTDRQTDRLVM
jgi:hypothetical protein